MIARFAEPSFPGSLERSCCEAGGPTPARSETDNVLAFHYIDPNGIINIPFFAQDFSMSRITHKFACSLALAIAASANIHSVLADNRAGSLGVGNANFSPTDVYGLTCPIGTASVRASATNPNGSPVDEISVLVINPNGPVRSAISIEGVAPPTVVLAGGAGNYLIAVHKDSSPAAVPYRIFMDCFNGGGVAFAPDQANLIQNQ